MSKQRGKFQLVFLLLLAFVTLTFANCSSSVPTESDGRDFFEAKGKEDNLFKVKSFTKTNGSGDEKVYDVEYQAELECLKSNSDPSIGVRVVLDHGIAINCDNAGETINRKGHLTFRKTEKGWLVVPDMSN